MGILRKGIFGGFENRTGPLVGRRINGESVVSAVQHQATKPRTRAQIDQQLKLELVVSLLKWFKGLITIGFKDPKGKKNSFNTAVKYNFKDIIIGNSPDYGVDYSKLVFSKGNLVGPNNPTIRLSTGAVVINWQADAQTQFNQYTDRANFMVYCPGKRCGVILIGAAERSALTFVVSIPENFAGHEIHGYMSFVTANGKAVSDSVYLGVI